MKTENGKKICNLLEVALTQQSAPLGKGFPVFKLSQLFVPQIRPSSQSSLLSQSPSLTVHLFVALQHDHVFSSFNGCPGVPDQSHLNSTEILFHFSFGMVMFHHTK